MSKINQEEYEILKSLDDKWKWIARDENTHFVNTFEEKPYKCTPVWMWKINSDVGRVESGESLFQFVRWEDSEPYNIKELIYEYELYKRLEYAGEWFRERAMKMSDDFREIGRAMSDAFGGVREETEVKKDKKWFVDKWTKERNKTDVHDPMYHFINEFIADVNQLDEPEILSQKWIDEHGRIGHFQHGGGIDFDYFVKARDLQNLLVPKQEEPTQEQVQKYNVKFKVKSSSGTVGIFLYKIGDEVLAGDNFRVYSPKEDKYRLTEQEIRDFQNGDILFEHFAVKVEELE